MRATVQIEGLNDRRIEGHVTKIAAMATLNYRSDVKYFEGIVKLENVPDGLRPGMTAEVEIALASSRARARGPVGRRPGRKRP